MTNKERVRRSLASDPYCEGCPYIEETPSHVFQNCQSARKVWHHLLGRENWHAFRIGRVKDWLFSNLEENKNKDGYEDWDIVFGVTLWLLWKWRNERVFNKKEFPTNSSFIIKRIAQDIISAREDTATMELSRKVERMIGW